MKTGALVGRTLADRFTLIELLGSGSMGEVYLAEHVRLRQRYAVKVLREQMRGDKVLAERFRREAYATSRLDHPNIVNIVDFGRMDDGRPYLVMEYVPGGSLEALLNAYGTRLMPLGRAAHILTQVGQALHTAHRHGIVHRDLKPDNILLELRPDAFDRVKILDFGLVKLVGGTDSQLTREGEIFGTPKYMSPEQCMAQPVDHRADIYAFGVLAYELLTGGTPFDYTSVPRQLLAHQRDPVPPLGERRAPAEPAVPQMLEALVMRCLSKEASGRPQSMREVLAVLELQLDRLSASSADTLAVVVSGPELTEGGEPDWESFTVEVTLTGPWRTSARRPAVEAAPQPWQRAAADHSAEWETSVAKAKLVAVRLQQHNLGSEELDKLLRRLVRLERQCRTLEAELTQSQVRLEEVESALREGESRLRHALLDLSLERDRRLDGGEVTETALGDLDYQIGQLEQRLGEHFEKRRAKREKIATAIHKRQSYLAIYRQKQVDAEITLLNLLHQLRPARCPADLISAYDDVAESLRVLPG